MFLLTGIVTGGYYNLGKWLDITQEPVKSDIIVCLGGGDWRRYQKSIFLYEKGFSTQKILLLTGADITPEMKRRGIPDGRITDLKKHHPQIRYLYLPQFSSSRAEIAGVKQYMAEHGYGSALIVTDPPHSRRFDILAHVVSVPGDETIHFRYVASGVKWWDKDVYYKNKTAKAYALTEFLKIPYNLYMLFMGR